MAHGQRLDLVNLDHDLSIDGPDMRRLRGLLAERLITHTLFASVCGLSRTNVSRFLAESVQPGERARRRLWLGMHILGLSSVQDQQDERPESENENGGPHEPAA